MALSETRKQADKRYAQSEKGKAANAYYAQTKKGRTTKIRVNAHYDQSKKRKIVKARYDQTEKGKIIKAHQHAKRKELGFKMINDWFEGCEGHHIDRENVLFIPAELHRLISHSQDDLESMQRMNDAAFKWFYIEEVI